MRRLSCLIALLACLVLALPAFAAPQKADAISGISSEKVLDIVKANKGKLVFINFFATWCPPCREEIPELISIRKAYPADKVVIVGISLDSDRGKLESFAEAMNFNYPVYLAEPDVPALFGISSIPFNLLYDKTGKLVAEAPAWSARKTLRKRSAAFSIDLVCVRGTRRFPDAVFPACLAGRINGGYPLRGGSR
jgi:thiol-disulfide isomerase/thioredoxin